MMYSLYNNDGENNFFKEKLTVNLIQYNLMKFYVEIEKLIYWENHKVWKKGNGKFENSIQKSFRKISSFGVSKV